MSQTTLRDITIPRHVPLLLAVGAALLTLSLMLGGTAAAQEDGATFEEADCMFTVPPGQSPQCGYLIVPEDRSDPGGSTIRLATAIFPSTNSNPAADPLIYLEGGPGGAVLENLTLIFDDFYAPLLEERDLILFDQRGVGFSEPSLFCEEYATAYTENLQRDPVAEDIDDFAPLLACQERLLAEGVNLSAYNSAANAADVSDLRIALGYDEVNLFGVSYGTRLALTVMRDNPEGVRSVVLGATYPPQVDLYTDQPEGLVRVLELLFTDCEADDYCGATYPDFRDVFFDTMDGLNASPATISIPDPVAGGTIRAVVDGDRFLNTIFLTLYSSDLIPLMPQVVYEVSQGEYSTFAFMLASTIFVEQAVSRGMYFSVQCHEEAPFPSMSSSSDALDRMPELVAYFSELDEINNLCDDWNSGEGDPIEGQPVSSDIPTLLIAGEYDPITPPEWAQLAATTLENSFYFEFPGLSHDASLVNPCARSIISSFLNDPGSAPASTCLADVTGVDFGGEMDSTVIMVPFSDDTFGIEGVVPDGWEELGPGTHMRAQSDLDSTVLLQQAGPIPREQFLELLLGQLEIDEAPEVEATITTASGFEWQLYRLETLGLAIDLGLGDASGLTMLVLLQSSPSNRDALYDSVFLPAVDAMRPN